MEPFNATSTCETVIQERELQNDATGRLHSENVIARRLLASRDRLTDAYSELYFSCAPAGVRSRPRKGITASSPIVAGGHELGTRQVTAVARSSGVVSAADIGGACLAALQGGQAGTNHPIRSPPNQIRYLTSDMRGS